MKRFFPVNGLVIFKAANVKNTMLKISAKQNFVMEWWTEVFSK